MESELISSSDLNGNPIDSLPFEEAVQQLEKIIDTLERGELTLESSLVLFERGQALARRCSFLLDQAEMKVKILSGDDLVDFEPET